MSDTQEKIQRDFVNDLVKPSTLKFIHNVFNKSLFDVVYFNVNTDRRLNGIIGKFFPNLVPRSRVQYIIDLLLKKIGMDQLYFLMECDGEMRDIIKQFCKENKIVCEEIKYNTSDGSFSHLVIAKFGFSFWAYPLTVSGERFDHRMRPAEPKSRDEQPSLEYQNYKVEILGDSFDKCLVQISLYFMDRWIHIYATHLGLSPEARKNQSRKIVEIITENSINKGIPFILGGDINSFDPASKIPALLMDQIDIFTNVGWNWITKHIPSTFKAYPFDIVFKMSKEEQDIYYQLLREEKPEFVTFCESMVEKYGVDGGALDHVFISRSLYCGVVPVDSEQVSDHYALVTRIQGFC